MIQNANKRLIGSSGLPNMSSTIIGWFQPIRFGKVIKSIVDFEEVSSIDYVDTEGAVQPYQPEVIEIQPEGVRNWEWQEIHCLPNFDVNINEFIKYKEKLYKVMKRENFTEYGYIRYLIEESYK